MWCRGTPRTGAQLRVRATFGAASRAWGESLREEERLALIAAGGRVRSRVRLGQSGRLTGQQYFRGEELREGKKEGRRQKSECASEVQRGQGVARSTWEQCRSVPWRRRGGAIGHGAASQEDRGGRLAGSLCGGGEGRVRNEIAEQGMAAWTEAGHGDTDGTNWQDRRAPPFRARNSGIRLAPAAPPAAGRTTFTTEDGPGPRGPGGPGWPPGRAFAGRQCRAVERRDVPMTSSE